MTKYIVYFLEDGKIKDFKPITKDEVKEYTNKIDCLVVEQPNLEIKENSE